MAQIDIYTPQFMLPAVKAITPRSTFLKDRYFPNGISFPTEKVLVDYKEDDRKIAPFISPRRGGITSYREGYSTYELVPPMIGEKRALTADDLKKRGFGEALFSGMSDDQRQGEILTEDLYILTNRIKGRMEEMAAQCLLNNAITGKIYTGEFGGSDYEEYEIKYYEGGSNDAVYTPAKKWNESGAAIIDDLYAMADSLASRGLAATDLICAPNVAAQFRKDSTLRDLLDNRRMEYGELNPQQLAEQGVIQIGVLNCDGMRLNIFSYNASYVNDAGTSTKFIPAGKVVVTAPGCGETIYGAVTQLEQGASEFTTYQGEMIPKYISDPVSEVRTVQLVSRPLLKPKQKAPWITATVL